MVTSAGRYCDPSCLLERVCSCVSVCSFVNMCWAEYLENGWRSETRFKLHGTPIGNYIWGNRMVTWPMTSHDHERSTSWRRYVRGLISRKRLETETRFKWSIYIKWDMGNRMVTWSMTSRDPLRAGSVACAWRRLQSLSLSQVTKCYPQLVQNFFSQFHPFCLFQMRRRKVKLIPPGRVALYDASDVETFQVVNKLYLLFAANALRNKEPNNIFYNWHFTVFLCCLYAETYLNVAVWQSSQFHFKIS